MSSHSVYLVAMGVFVLVLVAEIRDARNSKLDETKRRFAKAAAVGCLVTLLLMSPILMHTRFRDFQIAFVAIACGWMTHLRLSKKTGLM